MTTAVKNVHLNVGSLADLVYRCKVETAFLAMVTTQGGLKGKAVDASVLLRQLEGGTLRPEVCGYLLDTDLGMSASAWGSGFGDVELRPDLGRTHRLPWLHRTALVLADPVTADGRPLPTAPAAILRDQLAALEKLGYVLRVGLETEFVLYRGTAEQAADRGYRGQVPLTRTTGDYTLDLPTGAAEFTAELRRVLSAAGCPVEAVKWESAPGQVEVTFPYGDPLAACEQHLLFKHAARTLAERRGLTATFMAAPETGIGSGLHLHVSLWRDGEPVTCLPGAEYELSSDGQRAVAGVLAVLPDLVPMLAPYVNSYRRLQPRSFAPTRWTWGRDNRTCALRVVGRDRGLRIEVRVPGADANPYLALAAVAAGIRHGIANDLTPPEPIVGDGYDVGSARPLPFSLADALAAFEGSALATNLLGTDVTARLAGVAHLELDHHAPLVSTAEIARGLAHA
ncbi:glutamine synthetase family protein [Kitasatospora sp. NPDC051984]|uniref:glutamine synthetase family protein n=1 Tax=Kitasatospora sp. NPDC051984 TaxID=3364059 RepID=UPI0037C7FC26